MSHQVSIVPWIKLIKLTLILPVMTILYLLGHSPTHLPERGQGWSDWVVISIGENDWFETCHQGASFGCLWWHGWELCLIRIFLCKEAGGNKILFYVSCDFFWENSWVINEWPGKYSMLTNSKISVNVSVLKVTLKCWKWLSLSESHFEHSESHFQHFKVTFSTLSHFQHSESHCQLFFSFGFGSLTPLHCSCSVIYTSELSIFVCLLNQK